MRIFALSDIHIDFEENRAWIDTLFTKDYHRDALILAGDICHDTILLKETLLQFKERFKYLFFVPGNHDLWIRDQRFPDSVRKFEDIKRFCQQQKIQIQPVLLGENTDPAPVWVVPLVSWYSLPEEGPDSLFLPKPGEDENNRLWSDNYFIRWPQTKGLFHPAQFFLRLNKNEKPVLSEFPVITFSHFLPRKEMMFGESLKPDAEKIKKFDRNPRFNFSRVAGSSLIEEEIRRLGSVLHVYGHQHINRDRVLSGVRYVAHCLGYPHERSRGMPGKIDRELKWIWDTQSGMVGGTQFPG